MHLLNFNSTKVQFGVSNSLATVIPTFISIPLRYNLEVVVSREVVPHNNFNSTKVQFGVQIKNVKIEYLYAFQFH